MPPDIWKLYSEIASNFSKVASNVVTSLAVVVAGLWSYYTFVRGRTFKPRLQINLELKSTHLLSKQCIAVVRVSLKNIGRVKVEKEDQACVITCATLDLVQPTDFPLRIDFPVNFRSGSTYVIFERCRALEPDQEVSEDVAYSFEDARFIKVGVRLLGKRPALRWETSAVFDLADMGGTNSKRKQS